MYRQSSDRRFRRNKEFIRRAYIDLVMEKGYQNVTISDIAEHADINRMTFYSHYDAVEDVFAEFVDDMEEGIAQAFAEEAEFDIDKFFAILNEMMFKEIDFFRYVAKEGNCADFREAFRRAIRRILRVDIKSAPDRGQYEQKQGLVVSDLASTCIAYSYLDWLAGEYGEMGLDEVVNTTKAFLMDGYLEMSYVK